MPGGNYFGGGCPQHHSMGPQIFRNIGPHLGFRHAAYIFYINGDRCKIFSKPTNGFIHFVRKTGWTLHKVTFVGPSSWAQRFGADFGVEVSPHSKLMVFESPFLGGAHNLHWFLGIACQPTPGLTYTLPFRNKALWSRPIMKYWFLGFLIKSNLICIPQTLLYKVSFMRWFHQHVGFIHC